jgi:hypothetical protein
MGLAARLKQIELKMRPVTIAPERPLNIDQCIVHLGLDPAAVRELAVRTSRSLAETISAMLGTEPSEFARQLKEKANSRR